MWPLLDEATALAARLGDRLAEWELAVCTRLLALLRAEASPSYHYDVKPADGSDVSEKDFGKIERSPYDDIVRVQRRESKLDERLGVLLCGANLDPATLAEAA